MRYNFDEIIDRRASDSSKWNSYGEDVLPMPVADMDFRSPEPILRALHARVDHGLFGYGGASAQLREVICARMDRLYGWQVQPEEIITLPGLVCGLNVVSRAIGERGDGVVVNTPVYPPFLSAPVNQERELQRASLALESCNGNLHYAFAADAFKQAIQPNTRLFILCNPHNPVGRAYSKEELSQMAQICADHNLVICSDEIHCDLLLGGTQHTPIATLAPDVADRTITLLAPSKTFNIPGLGCSLAIIQNAELRNQVKKASAGIVPHVNLLGYAAAIAAYTECQEWHEELLAYLTANRDFAVNYVAKHLPQLRITVPEATYLAWIDCRASGIEGNPQKFFLQRAKVALGDGAAFGSEGMGFVRMNFGCPRALLEQGLEQICEALASLG
ncbi:MAG: PatB family C-S lyase [Caldilineaceae bacterium]